MNTEQTYWFDSVPQHWQIKRLKDIASLNNDRTERKDMPYIALENIKSWDAVFVPSVVETDGINNVYHKGNVLFAKLRPYLAKGYITREDGICSTEFFVLSPNKLITNKYLLYYILSHSVIDYLKHQVAGTKMPRTTWDDFSNVKVALPPLAEQIKIANYLDDKISGINAQIVAREKELQLLQGLKKAKVTEIATNGLSPNVPLKDSGIPSIGMIPAHWEVKRLKELFEFGSGLPISKADLLETGISVISYGQIHAKFNRGTKVEEQLIRYVDPSYLETNPSSLVNKGDVIFADTSEDLEGCGNCVFIDKQMPLFAGYHTVILRCRKENPYLAYLFQSSNWREQIRKRVCGVKLYSITKTILNSVYVILPPIEEQIQIVEYLDHECEQIEKKCTLIDKQIQQLQLLKRALINEVVTGKKTI